MKDLKTLTPFQFFALTNFPYIEADFDALTNYQLFCEITKYLNEISSSQNDTIENFNELLQNWNDFSAALTQEWENTKDYIDNYFDNLDVQEEINNKLDDLVRDGTMSSLVEPFIPALVTSWLNAHITQETGYVIDDTLTVAGAAADAKATGERISDVNNALNDFTFENIFYGSTIEHGYIASDGSIISDTGSDYTSNYIEVDSNETYAVNFYDRNIGVVQYDANKTFISRTWLEDSDFTLSSTCKFIRLTTYNLHLPNDFALALSNGIDYVLSTQRYSVNGESITNSPFEKNITTDVVSPTITESDLEYVGNYFPAGNGVKTALSTFYWYQITALNDFELWCDDFAEDNIIALYNNDVIGTQSFVARYRGSDGNLPTENNKLFVSKGQVLVVSTYQTQNFILYADGFYNGKKILNNNILLNSAQIEQVKNKISVVSVTNGYDIKMNGYVLKLRQVNNSATRADLWNINGITKNDNVIVPEGTDIIGVLWETGENDYMGGVHGDETNVDFYFLADGKEITEDCECDQIDILMYSHLTRVSTGDNIIDRYVHVTLKDNYMDVETTFKCLVDNFSLAYAYNGGMFAWYQSDVDFEMCNIGVVPSTGITAGSVYKSSDLYSTTVILNDATISIENIIGHEKDSFVGDLYYYGSEQNPRMKIYYGTDDHSTWNIGHICKGKARYTLM